MLGLTPSLGSLSLLFPTSGASIELCKLRHNIYLGGKAAEVRIVKAMVFLVVMHGCESWTIKKTEHWRIDAFELWCWKRLLRVPWTARRSNQSVLKEINPEYSLEELMLKLKLQYFGHLIWRTDSLGKTLMWEREKAKGEGGSRGWDGHIASSIQWTQIWPYSRK